MSLTLSEKYVAQNTLYLYDQILNVGFYTLIWKGVPITAAWDYNNNYVANVFGNWNFDDDDMKDLKEVIFDFIVKNNLTSDN